MTVTDPHGDTTCTPRDAAHTYAALGWRVLPITPGRKHPPIQGWQDAATTSPDVIDSWWTGLYRDHGVGIATGPGTGVWVLDIDVSDGKPGRANLQALEAEHGPLPRTVAAATGSGGRHLLFAWDPARPVTNGDAAHLPAGLDIRGHGGQIVVAPTVHPSGTPYTWVPGREPGRCPVAPAPDWLYHIIHPPTPPAPAPAPVPSSTGDPGDSAAEWLRQQHTWADVLERDGWTVHSQRGDDTYWTRPGKNPRDGHSAVQHGDGALVIWTTEIPAGLTTAGRPTADGSGLAVSLFGYLAGTRYGGDRSACARDARLAINALQRPAAGLHVPAPMHTPDPADDDGQGGDEGGAVDRWAAFGAWRPADLTRYLDPNWAPDPPTLLARDDGACLYYRRNVNWLHGASGEGKTWVALVAVAQELMAGRDVVWVHYEDPEADKITHRLILLGVPAQVILDRFHVCVVGSASMVDGIPMLRAVITFYAADLVVIDSIGEAIGSDGIAVKDDEKFVAWIHQTCRVLAADGSTVLGIDHLPMGEPGRLDPVGSFRKKAATTGSMFLAESPKAPTKGKAGYIKLTCAKDRSGAWTKGDVAAIIHMDPKPDGGIQVTVTAPRAATGDQAGEPAEIVLARHAVRTVVKYGRPLSRTELAASMIGVKGRTTAKRQGIDFALLQGWLKEEPGPRGGRLMALGDVPVPTADDLLERWEDA